MICTNCGKNNKERYKFCTRCGTKLNVPYELNPVYNAGLDSFENEKTMDLDDVRAFENEETMDLDDVRAFENDETVMLDDITAFENDETVILDDIKALEDDETVMMDDDTAPTAKEDTTYVEHLRRLSELLDDGIITEEEFRRKKEQILGI